MKVGQHKVQSDMDLLGWKEVTTSKQKKNGTRIFQLPIKMYGQYIEVGSFKSGYVRRMNGGYTPYQLNKCEPNTEYHAEYKWCTIQRTSLKTGKYTQYIGKKRILIPHEVDRIERLIAYSLKNYYINRANEVEETKKYTQKLINELQDIKRNDSAGKYTWSGGQVTDNETGKIYVHEQHAYWNNPIKASSIQVIVDGHRYKIK